MTRWILIIVGIIVLVSGLALLFKSFVKVFLAFLIVALLFKIGFIWSPDEVITNLNLDRFVKPEYQTQIEKGLNGFAEKRKESEIVDANEIENIVKEVIDSTTEEAFNKLSDVEAKEVLDNLTKKLEGLDENEIDEKIKELIDKVKNKEPENIPTNSN